MSTYGRCPLRLSQRLAAGVLAGQLGIRRLAARLGTNVIELQAVLDGTTAPTLSDRSSLISELVKAGLIGRAQGDYSDQHGPCRKEGLEELGTRQQRQATFAARDRGGDV
jgi:hypothetical protein